MKSRSLKLGKLRAVLAIAALALTSVGMASAATAAPVHNIVLVHGAFVNGAGWKPVYDILVKDGYHVSVAAHLLTMM
jgi:hypothetical protein